MWKICVHQVIDKLEEGEMCDTHGIEVVQENGCEENELQGTELVTISSQLEDV